MECKLYKETPTSNVFAVNRSFYLIVPKLRVNPNIEVIIDYEVRNNLEAYFNSSNIGIIRIYAKNYFDDIDDEISCYKLKSIINTDISITKQILTSNNIEYNDNVIITTPFEKFKEWYINENTRQDTYKRIKNNVANPTYLVKEDSISESQKRINELKELKKEVLESSGQTSAKKSKKGKVKTLSNGHSLLDYQINDGFINIIFLSLVTISVSLVSLIKILNLIVK